MWIARQSDLQIPGDKTGQNVTGESIIFDMFELDIREPIDARPARISRRKVQTI